MCSLRSLFFAAGWLMPFACAIGSADESLLGTCRSVHLRYAAPASAFYNIVTVDQSAPGTYFCVCGWDQGYFGIQELANGKQLVLFSVWDSAGMRLRTRWRSRFSGSTKNCPTRESAR